VSDCSKSEIQTVGDMFGTASGFLFIYSMLQVGDVNKTMSTVNKCPDFYTPFAFKVTIGVDFFRIT